MVGGSNEIAYACYSCILYYSYNSLHLCMCAAVMELVRNSEMYIYSATYI